LKKLKNSFKSLLQKKKEDRGILFLHFDLLFFWIIVELVGFGFLNLLWMNG
jgi:hypothetical protein